MSAGDPGGGDNEPDLIEVTGTPELLMKLPLAGKFTLLDHGQTELDDGRWKIFVRAGVSDTPAVLAAIQALGLEAVVPRSVAERERDMQPTPGGGTS